MVKDLWWRKLMFSDEFFIFIGIVIFLAIFVLLIKLLIFTMKSPLLNRIITLFFNITRAFLIGIAFYKQTEVISMLVTMGISSCITSFLVLYGFGSTAFDDTRRERRSIILNPIEGGAYEFAERIQTVGDSPMGNFVSAIIISGIAGIAFFFIQFGGTYVIVKMIPGLKQVCGSFVLLLPVSIATVIGIIRAIISLIQYFKNYI